MQFRYLKNKSLKQQQVEKIKNRIELADRRIEAGKAIHAKEDENEVKNRLTFALTVGDFKK